MSGRSIVKIGIAGLGLIGGSFAKALSKLPDCAVFGCDKNPEVVDSALEEASVIRVLDSETLPFCDVILLALYPEDAVEFMRETGKYVRSGAVVCDLCGVKSFVFEKISAQSASLGFDYAGGHPMAGIEYSGYANSDAKLFEGASMILCPSERCAESNLDLLAALCRRIGFSRITLSDPERHDRMIAYTSQLAHIVSSAYIKSPSALGHEGFSAGSFRDMTRVARLNPDMWSQLFCENALPLKTELDALIARLAEYSEAVGNRDRESLRRLLDEGDRMKKLSEKTAQNQ